MTIHPETEEPGFEHKVNELPKSQKDHQDTLEDEPAPMDEADAPENAREEAADERKKRDYQ